MARLSLIPRPAPAPVMRKPVYPRVPLFGPPATDRRSAWQAKRDALEAERNRETAQAMSSRMRPTTENEVE